MRTIAFATQKGGTIYYALNAGGYLLRRRWIREQGMLDPARLVFNKRCATNSSSRRLIFESAVRICLK